MIKQRSSLPSRERRAKPKTGQGTTEAGGEAEPPGEAAATTGRAAGGTAGPETGDAT